MGNISPEFEFFHSQLWNDFEIMCPNMNKLVITVLLNLFSIICYQHGSKQKNDDKDIKGDIFKHVKP